MQEVIGSSPIFSTNVTTKRVAQFWVALDCFAKVYETFHRVGRLTCLPERGVETCFLGGHNTLCEFLAAAERSFSAR